MGTRTTVRPGSGSDRWFEIKSKIHAKLLSSLNPDQLRTLNKESVRAQIGGVVERLVGDEGIPMTLAERERVIEEILDEVFGLGPLEPLLKDPSISDILVNGFDNVYVERGGRMVKTTTGFKDATHVRLIIGRIVSAIGRRIDDSSPIVDARLADGSRVCAVIPPLSLIGPVISIRRYGKKVLSSEDLLKNETFTTGMLDFMSGCVEARLNVVVSGGSGSGKTTMLDTLSRFIPEEERIITIEDTAELQLQQSHVVRLETRPINMSSASAPRDSPTMMRSGRIRSVLMTRSRCVIAPAPSMLMGRVSRRTTCDCWSCSSAVSSMVMMRSSSGMKRESVLSMVVLPEPDPPETTTLSRASTQPLMKSSIPVVKVSFLSRSSEES